MDDIPQAADFSLAKLASGRALGAHFVAVDPEDSAKWTLPAGDALLQYDDPDLADPIYVRVRTLDTEPGVGLASGAIADSKGWVQRRDGRLMVLPAARVETGDDAATDLATRHAASAAATVAIYMAFKAMQVEGPSK